MKGFTLIETLVVIAIIGIIAATSLQIFIELRKRGYDSRAMQDLRNVAQAEEGYFSEAEAYRSCASASACTASLPGVKALSAGVTLAVTATTSGFVGSATHPKGSGIVYAWDSNLGGLH